MSARCRCAFVARGSVSVVDKGFDDTLLEYCVEDDVCLDVCVASSEVVPVPANRFKVPVCTSLHSACR